MKAESLVVHLWWLSRDDHDIDMHSVTKKTKQICFLLDIFVTIKNEEISHQKELHSHYYWWTDFNTKYFQFWKRKYDFLIPTLFFSYSKQVQIYFVIFFTECRSVKNHIHREMCESFSIVVVVAVLNYSQSPFLYIYT